MADYWPSANGLWSTLSNWLTAAATPAGVLPTSADDVYADGKIVYVNTNANVASLRTTARTGGIAGGNFYPNNGVSLSAVNIIAGTTVCVNFLSAFPNICTLVGNISGSASTGVMCVNNNTTGTVIIYGNTEGGLGASSSGIYNASSGTITIYGDVSGVRAAVASSYGATNASTGVINLIGNSYGKTSTGIFNSSTGTVYITGNVFGGPTTGANGATNNSTGLMIINGNAIGGTASGSFGVSNGSAGRVLINGNVVGGDGSSSRGANNAATGYLSATMAIGNSWGLGSSGIGGAAAGIFGSQTGTTIIASLSCGIRGQWPTEGNIFVIPQSTSTATLFTSASAAQVLFTSLSTNIVPPASSVRLGTVYNLNQSTGICAVPSISSVLQGVSVDNSIGIAALQPQTIWNYSVLSATDVNSLGGKLANVATVQSVGQQLTALNL